MILSDREIKLVLRRDQIRITPTPSDKAISSTPVDLTRSMRKSHSGRLNKSRRIPPSSFILVAHVSLSHEMSIEWLRSFTR